MGKRVKKLENTLHCLGDFVTGFNDWEWRNPLLETPTLVETRSAAGPKTTALVSLEIHGRAWRHPGPLLHTQLVLPLAGCPPLWEVHHQDGVEQPGTYSCLARLFGIKA